MRIKSPVVLGIILLVGTVALAQGDHKIEATVDYSYVRGNPQNNNIIPTFSSNAVVQLRVTSPSTAESKESLRAMAAVRTILLSLPRTVLVKRHATHRLRTICSPTTFVRS